MQNDAGRPTHTHPASNAKCFLSLRSFQMTQTAAIRARECLGLHSYCGFSQRSAPPSVTHTHTHTLSRRCKKGSTCGGIATDCSCETTVALNPGVDGCLLFDTIITAKGAVSVDEQQMSDPPYFFLVFGRKWVSSAQASKAPVFCFPVYCGRAGIGQRSNTNSNGPS